jgi:hypothetical protein
MLAGVGPVAVLVPRQAAQSRVDTMRPHPRATFHHGTCLQCGGEGEVLTIANNRFMGRGQRPSRSRRSSQ